MKTFDEYWKKEWLDKNRPEIIDLVDEYWLESWTRSGREMLSFREVAETVWEASKHEFLEATGGGHWE